jgi:hypothetical protein
VNSANESGRKPKPTRRPSSHQGNEAQERPSGSIGQPLGDFSLSELQDELLRRRTEASGSLRATRDRLLGQLREIDLEITKLESDLRATARGPSGRVVRGEIAERAGSVSEAVAPAPTRPASGDAPSKSVVPSAVHEPRSVAPVAPTPPVTGIPRADVVREGDRAATAAGYSEASRAPVAAKPGATGLEPRPQSIGKIVLGVVAEAHPDSLPQKIIVERVRARLDRERTDLERAVAQAILNLRASGALDATAFEEYAVTDAGRARV